MRVANTHEWLAVGGIFLVANVVNCAYFAFGRPPSCAFGVLYVVALGWVMAAWVIADSRRLQVPLPFDMGWFVFFAWPFVIPYHAFKTRGVRGVFVLATFLALYFVSYLLGLVVYYAIILMRNGSTAAP